MTSKPRIGVLALQGDVREHVHALEACGADAVPVRRERELVDLDGLVLPGGESTTMSNLLVRFELIEPVRALVRGGLPTYGSCAGMILLADTVICAREDHEGIGGLDVVVRRNAFGRQVDSFEEDLEMAGVGGGPVHAVFIRAPWVEAAGPEVEVLATLAAAVAPEAVGRIVAVRQGSLLATSFHPELTGDARVHRHFVDLVRGREVRGRAVRGQG